MAPAAEHPLGQRLDAVAAQMGQPLSALMIGSAQAELAGPLTGAASGPAAKIGAVAGAEFPHLLRLPTVAMATSVEDDFHGGLGMLLAGIAAVSR